MTQRHGTLSEIFFYPIKSCAAVAASEVEVTDLGIRSDRHWVIVDDEGRFQTQRQIPHLVWIKPTLSAGTMTLQAPSQPDLTVPLANDQARPLKITVWRDRVLAHDMGDEAARWLDDFLQIPGRHFRLAQFDPNHPRVCDMLWTGDGASIRQHPFTDAFSLNILSRPALDNLNEKLAQHGLDPVSIERFRPNLVIDDVPAHEEDQIASIQIPTPTGTLTLELVKPCVRCQIPEIDPYTAIREPGVTDVLDSYRRNANMGDAICFGIQAVIRDGAPLRLSPGPFTYTLRTHPHRLS